MAQTSHFDKKKNWKYMLMKVMRVELVDMTLGTTD